MQPAEIPLQTTMLALEVMEQERQYSNKHMRPQLAGAPWPSPSAQVGNLFQANASDCAHKKSAERHLLYENYMQLGCFLLPPLNSHAHVQTSF